MLHLNDCYRTVQWVHLWRVIDVCAEHMRGVWKQSVSVLPHLQHRHSVESVVRRVGRGISTVRLVAPPLVTGTASVVSRLSVFIRCRRGAHSCNVLLWSFASSNRICTKLFLTFKMYSFLTKRLSIILSLIHVASSNVQF